MNASVEAKQRANHLLEQLGPGQLDAVVNLLEVMVQPDDDDALNEEDRQAVAASREYFRQNPKGGVPFAQVVAECGFTMDEVLNYKGDQ
jgi:hypothetical protein